MMSKYIVTFTSDQCVVFVGYSAFPYKVRAKLYVSSSSIIGSALKPILRVSWYSTKIFSLGNFFRFLELTVAIITIV